MISFILFVNSLGLMIIFMNVFGDTAKAFFSDLIWSEVTKENENFGMTRVCWVLVIGVLLLPFTYMKQLAELKELSITLFCGAIIFVVTNIIQLIFRGVSFQNPDLGDTSSYWTPKFGKLMIQSIATISTAFNYNANLFPIYEGQKDKTVKGSLQSIGLAMGVISSIYISLAVATINMYGSSIQQSLLKNLGD